MILTEQEIEVVRSEARRAWQEIPVQARLSHSSKPSLDNEQRTAVAWIKAVADLLCKKGLVPPESIDKVEVELEVADLEPDTEP